MSPTLRLLSWIHRAGINPRTLEPRWGFSFILYYGIGIFVAFIILTMVLFCLEAYDLAFARNILYRQLGEPLLSALESLLF